MSQTTVEPKNSNFILNFTALSLFILGVWLLFILIQDVTKTPAWIIRYGVLISVLNLFIAPLIFMRHARNLFISFCFLSGIVLAAVMLDGKVPEGSLLIFPFIILG